MTALSEASMLTLTCPCPPGATLIGLGESVNTECAMALVGVICVCACGCSFVGSCCVAGGLLAFIAIMNRITVTMTKPEIRASVFFGIWIIVWFLSIIEHLFSLLQGAKSFCKLQSCKVSKPDTRQYLAELQSKYFFFGTYPLSARIYSME